MADHTLKCCFLKDFNPEVFKKFDLAFPLSLLQLYNDFVTVYVGMFFSK